MTIRPAGDLGLLIELPPAVSLEQLHGSAAAARQIPGVRACIAGHASLYLIFDSSEKFADRSRRVESHLHTAAAEFAVQGRTHRIAVSIHPECAPDLEQLLSAAAMDRGQFQTQLGSLRLRARYLGFRPGFAYLEGIPEPWRLPRLAQPRIRVPAGSLGITGRLAAFYPSDSPGGWNLIGRAAASFWDPQREPPNLIAPGDEILLDPTAEKLTFSSPPAPEQPLGGTPVAEVMRPGQLTLIVGPAELDRYAIGLPAGGPFDQDAATAANLAVGNSSAAPLLECVLVGPQLRFTEACKLAWHGAHAEMLIDEREVRDPRRFEVRSGEVVTIGRLQKGLRGYLAISGGISNPAPRYEMAPAVIRAGSKLWAGSGSAMPGEVRQLPRENVRVIRALEGPHSCDKEELQALQDQLWEVTPALDRTGIRLRPTGGVIEQPADLPSCGMQFGTIQWHPSGELVAMGPDHPMTGGYRQPLTVFSSERWKLAQLVPGDRVRWMVEKVGQ